MTDADRRAAVVAEARTWKGTPFAWEQVVRGVGVDCGRFVAASFNGAGAKKIDIASFAHWQPDWFLHKRDEDPSPYINQILRFAVEYKLGETKKIPSTADLVVAKVGRDWAHSALVIEWPHVISCTSGYVVTEYRNIFSSPSFGSRPMRFFDFLDPKAREGNV